MKAALSSTRNSPNQQWDWVGPGRVPPYNLFEFALIHVAAKSKRPPEIGCSFHNCAPKLDHGNVPIDHCFLVTQRGGMKAGGRGKQTTNPPKKGLQNSRELSCSKTDSGQLSSDTKWGSGHCLLPLLVLPSPFF